MKAKQERIEVAAVVKEKRELPYQDIASTRGIPTIKPIYEVVFEAEGEKILFSLDPFSYDVLEVGDTGLLVYHKKKYCNELIRFGDKLKEVTE